LAQEDTFWRSSSVRSKAALGRAIEFSFGPTLPRWNEKRKVTYRIFDSGH
jgi:hypothetical protein